MAVTPKAFKTDVASENSISGSSTYNSFAHLSPRGHLNSNQATIIIGEQVIGFAKDLSISDESGNQQIFEVGTPLATDIVSGKIKVDISGTIYLDSSDNLLFKGKFLPKNPFELMAQTMAGVTFDIVFAIKDLPHPTIYGTSYSFTEANFSSITRSDVTEIVKVYNCRCSKIVTSINMNSIIESKFNAIGQYIEKQTAVNPWQSAERSRTHDDGSMYSDFYSSAHWLKYFSVSNQS